jgi:K(+)-stimulated pyrophosphate-energized sodium pump
VLAGLALGVGVMRITEHYTTERKPHARRLAEEGSAGPAMNVLSGWALAMTSCAWPALWIAVAAGLAWYMAGAYGVALAAIGLLSTLVLPLAVHAFGSVAENAGGIADMVRVQPETRRRTEALDAAAAATASMGKGYATAAAVLTALALFAAFRHAFDRLHPEEPLRLDLLDIQVQLGLLLGAALPFLFAGRCARAVADVARTLCDETLRWFRERRPPGAEPPAPDHGKFVALGVRRSVRRAGPAALLALGAPLVCGFSPLGPWGLVGLLVGATVSGAMLAMTLANAGAAWDSAKRYVSTGVFGGKGSPAYRAAVTGDIVGDPMKDAAGPGIHTLVKLMALLSLALLPLFPV